ncbi:hypothetical protein [Nocardioides coralli]|uniref:hypothetical protein n=1 Tax=Nocardioides coralli TaxID=2872154 RepID=UPI001CA42C6C|nr:hypothetical protein [Nocardioides coralli]QZY29518.1 hypothetical protein K6T13_02135 [Nocardioides coralli]
MNRPWIASASVMSLLTAVVVTVTGSSPAHGAGITYISFEDVPRECSFSATKPLRDRYAAAKFRGPAARDGGAVLDECGSFGVDARTGDRFLAFNDEARTANDGRPVGPETITLPRRQKSVTVWVSQGGGALGDAAFRLVGKRNGRTVRTATVATSTAAWVQLQVKSSRGFDTVRIAATSEPDGVWLLDDLTMRS